MTEWRETWRSPASRMPEERRFVVVQLRNGYVRTAFFREGRFLSGSKENAYELDVDGWIPFPRGRERLTVNAELPPEVAIPYLVADLRRAMARIAELEALLAGSGTSKGEDCF